MGIKCLKKLLYIHPVILSYRNCSFAGTALRSLWSHNTQENISTASTYQNPPATMSADDDDDEIPCAPLNSLRMQYIY
jgi:hypothetical protein